MEQQLERLKIATNTQSDTSLAKTLGISQGSISNAKTSGTIPAIWFIKVAEKFDVSMDWLVFGIGSMQRGETAPAVQVSARHCDEDADLVMIPRVAARLCAGTGSLETDDNVVGMYAFRADWILKKGNTKRMVLMDVTGDSMAPAIMHGDIVLIDQSKTDIYGHGYYAVGIDDVIFLKEVLIEPGIMIFRSINKDYDDIRIDRNAEEAENVRIIGRILWVARELS